MSLSSAYIDKRLKMKIVSAFADMLVLKVLQILMASLALSASGAW